MDKYETLVAAIKEQCDKANCSGSDYAGPYCSLCQYLLDLIKE